MSRIRCMLRDVWMTNLLRIGFDISHSCWCSCFNIGGMKDVIIDWDFDG